jgi:hypothetical protein
MARRDDCMAGVWEGMEVPKTQTILMIGERGFQMPLDERSSRQGLRQIHRDMLAE